MSGSGLAMIESTDLTELQKGLHSYGEGSVEKPEIRFHCVYKRFTWSMKITVPMESMKSESAEREGADKITFQVGNKLDFLRSCYMVMKTPQIKVAQRYKGKIEICLPHNLGHNIYKEAHLSYNGDPIQTINSRWMDVWSQTLLVGDRKMYSMGIGNVRMLNEWTDHIPSYKLMMPQAWFFCDHVTKCIPLFMSSLGKFTIEYILRTRYSDLVRMRAKVDEKSWKPIKYEHRFISEGKKKDCFPDPQMWGRYSKISTNEKGWWKDMGSVTLYKDISMLGSKDPIPQGSAVDIDISLEDPICALFWIAEDVEARQYSAYSNYTCNPLDHTIGWSPISKTSLGYGTVARFDKLDSIHTSMAEPFYELSDCPLEQGYNMFSFSYNLNGINGDTTIFTGKQKITMRVYIDDTDPVESIKEEDEEDEELFDRVTRSASGVDEEKSKSKFNVFVFAYVMKSITYKFGQKSVTTSSKPKQVVMSV